MSTDVDPNKHSRSWTKIDELADRHLDSAIALDPVFATFMGIAGFDDQLTDYSPDGHAARAELARSTLSALGRQAAVDDVDRVTSGAMRERLGLELELHEAGVDLADLNNIASPVQTLREIFDVAPTATERDWADIATRLAGIAAALDGYRAALLAARAGGWVPAARQVLAGAGQADEFAAADGFFVRLAEGAALAGSDGLPETLRARLADVASQAATGYGELADWLRAELLPAAREDDAVGREAYALHARRWLGSTVDLDDTYAWGLDELGRIEARMSRLARSITPDAPADDTAAALEAGIAALDADPATTIEGAENFREWMQALSNTAVDALAGTHFDIPDPIRTLICRIAPSTSGGVYYTGPSEDLSRPGQMWWAVPAGVTQFSTWREASTVYHEGVPGHHLQSGHTVFRSDRLNRWRRLGTWVSGHGEGWALYAERLMEELGYLGDPGYLMGMLDAHALRACRVVVDIGVHCRLPAPAEVGGGTWDAAKAWTFLRTHVRTAEPNLRFELNRYLGWPAQAISYKVGERVWLGLREEVRRREGAAFDLKSFHRRALDLGSVGLDVLRDAVLTP